MNITPVDSQNNLFRITDIFPKDILDIVVAQDWQSLPWEKQEMQERWPRRKVVANDATPLFDQYLSDNVDIISDAIGVKLGRTLMSVFWVDSPGIEYNVTPHLDNQAVKVVMQAYWTEGPAAIGTSFFNDEEGKSIRFSVPHINNTGYILVNHPTAWHGITEPVTTNRTCSYTYFSFPN